MSAFLRERAGSFRNAVRGITELVRTETHAKVHLGCTVIVTAAAATISLSSVEWCLIVLSIGLVWTAEALNTALERVVDLTCPTRNSLAGQAKDLAAGAVLLAAITAAAVGLLVFLPRICEYL
ncbi:MAG: diacylglycerol kinase family protein [Fuerstiella sp.]|nr:diacylglycerol kinase family protein [Fuerstiella sp.]